MKVRSPRRWLGRALGGLGDASGLRFEMAEKTIVSERPADALGRAQFSYHEGSDEIEQKFCNGCGHGVGSAPPRAGFIRPVIAVLRSAKREPPRRWHRTFSRAGAALTSPLRLSFI